MARSRAARRRKRDGGVLLNIHQFANMLVANGDEVQTVNSFLNEGGLDGGDFTTAFDGRIGLLETKEGATNKFEPTYHCITQVLSHKHDKKRGHTWKTQAWKLSGGKETNGVYYNDPDDIFLLPAHRSTILFGKGKNRKQYQLDYNLNIGHVKLIVVDDNSNSQRTKRSKKAATNKTPDKNSKQTQSKMTPDKNSKQSKRKSKTQANSKSNLKQTTPQSNSKSNRKQTTPQSNSKSNRKQTTPQSNSKINRKQRTPKPKAPVGSAVKQKRLSSARRRAARNKHEAHADTALDDTPKSKGKKRYVYDHRMRDSYMTITCLTHICNSYV